MDSYFPAVSHVPEELMFEILKNLQTGAIWLFCRGVSRAWKRHVDSYIERYYYSYALSLQNERKRSEREFGGRTWEWRRDDGRRADADMLYLEVGWNSRYRRDKCTSFLEFECSQIEVPELRARDLSVEDWDERITFRAVAGEAVYCSHNCYGLSRMYHHLFPGFKQVEREPFSWDGAPLRDGTWTLSCGLYELAYSLHYSLSISQEFIDNIWVLKIHYIKVPMRDLLRFSSPHVVRKVPVPMETSRSRYASSLFNTISDHL